jgi:hypothetical protein
LNIGQERGAAESKDGKPLPHVMELASNKSPAKSPTTGNYMSHFENIKRAVEFSRHRKAVCKDKFKIMSGFEAQFKKEVLKQVNQMIEANPELRKNRQILALTSKISKSASKAAKDETIKEILYRSTLERRSLIQPSVIPGQGALGVPSAAALS